MIFTAFSDGRFDLDGREVRCSLGRSGVIPAADKREGDGASPLGVWPLRRLIYRPDRGGAPQTALPSIALQPDDGWCEDPQDPNYNQPVKQPYSASTDWMWRQDHLYDLVVVLGHNDDPVVPGAGSAIFLHLARPGYSPTQGCIGLTREDLEALLERARPGDALAIRKA
jgi:L,D-peptidoglycan transpeptidase YkuD (ErfK/YbiS/YcfS/YnhG family)